MADRDEPDPPIPVTRDEVRQRGRGPPVDGDEARRLFLEDYQRKQEIQRRKEAANAVQPNPGSKAVLVAAKTFAAACVLYFIMYM